MDDIHERLAHVRETTGLGLRSFAREVEERTGYAVSHTTVSSYESGGTVPVAYTVAVSDAFDLRTRWLVTGAGTSRGSSMEAFFDHHPQPAIALDGDELTLVAANRAFRRRFGQSHGDGAGPEKLDRLLHPEDRDDARSVLSGHLDESFRARVESPRGWVPATVIPFRAESTVFCALRDLGEVGQGGVESSAERERTGP